ncbi:hypothetical protein EGI22_02950 [Lacihabitans sp. LS3-19]|uniref:hypothetical protein n=1 Tax=Lacihabitans sp. LS3-19 TaxID=2487335 RepID=UPI0020CEE658|nr:hypothetical protein [Lacihabitans sp. LS3-19]MCP9766850.1 hypothetical protein [Lacihabitans sp. LS3-19]
MRKTLLYIALPFIFWQCQEAETVTPVDTTSAKTKLITAQKWNIFKYTIGTPNTPTRSISQLATETTGPYYTDFSFAYITFKSDGTYNALEVYNELSENLSWEWIKNESEINFQRPGLTEKQPAIVEVLDKSNLRLHYYYKKGLTPDSKWKTLSDDLRSKGFGIGFTEAYIIIDYLAAK